MPWHGHQRCLPAIQPAGGCIDSDLFARSVPPLVNHEGMCQHCQGGQSSFCCCGFSNRPTEVAGCSYGCEDPSLSHWCSGAIEHAQTHRMCYSHPPEFSPCRPLLEGSHTHRVVRHNVCHGHQHQHVDAHPSTTRTVRRVYTYQQPQQTQQVMTVQAPPAPPPPPQPVMPVAVMPPAPVQPVMPEAYPRRPLMAVGFSFPSYTSRMHRMNWSKRVEKVETATAAYVSNLSHLKNLGLTRFNPSCGGYGYSTTLLNFRW